MWSKLLYFQFTILLLLFSNCSVLTTAKSSSYFNFKYENDSYSIRSVTSSEKSKAFNQLVGKNLVVRDIDRDGVVDQIVIGNKTLAESQKIYAFGLDILADANKLNVQKVLFTHYIQQNTEYNYHLKSFEPKGSTPFNEFKITNKNNDPASEIILLDQEADGNLDEVLKGPQQVNMYQSNYDYVLHTGLKRNKLVKSGNKILVKK